MLEGFVLLFFVIFSPLILGVIFLLFRLSSRFGYSITTIRIPLLVIAVATIYAICFFTNKSDISSPTMPIWLCVIVLIATITSWIIDSRYLHRLVKKRVVTVKKINSTREVVKILARIILVAVIAPLATLILGILWLVVTNPIFDNLNHDKFTTLDTQMHGVYNNLKTASNGVDNWNYKTVCSPNASGWMPDGTYNCIVSISTQKTVTSVEEINSLQAKYYPIVDKNQTLKQKTELDPEMPSDFGKNFVVSSTEKHYAETSSKIECRYLFEVNQSSKNRDKNYDSYGTILIDSIGDVVISIRCDDTARQPWYELVQNTSMLIPE